MIIQSQSEREMFLFIFGSPYKTFCKCMNLTSGVMIIIILDIITGFFNSILGLFMVFNISYYLSSSEPIEYFFVISALINMIGLPFAVIGLNGITKSLEKDLKLYYQFKIVELFAEGFVNIIEAEIVTIHRYYYYTHIHETNLVYNLIGVFLIIMLSGFFTKVVWSALIRLKYQELESSVELYHS